MGLRFPSQQFCNFFFVTTTFREWQPLGNVSGMYEALAVPLNFYSKKYKAGILGYVFMPTHLHLVISIDGGKLASFMRDFKKFIAQKAVKELGVDDHTIWMPRYDRVAITTEDVLRIKLEYIHNNPAKAGLVSSSKAWQWSSAGRYAGGVKSGVDVVTDWSQL